MVRCSQIDQQLFEYDRVEKLLYSLPNQVEHEALVPVADNGGPNVEYTSGGFVRSSSSTSRAIPPLAFMSASIRHTNEILVHLGGDWFVERSACQALDILKRRTQKLQHHYQQAQEERKRTEEWLAKVQEVQKDQSEYVEIVEPFDAESEAKWREQHRERVRKAKQQEANERKRVQFDLSDLAEKDESAMDEESEQIKLETELESLNILTVVDDKQGLSKCESKVRLKATESHQEDDTMSPIPQIKERNVNQMRSQESEIVSNRPVSKFKAARMCRSAK